MFNISVYPPHHRLGVKFETYENTISDTCFKRLTLLRRWEISVCAATVPSHRVLYPKNIAAGEKL